jgi:hypothetical protein
LYFIFGLKFHKLSAHSFVTSVTKFGSPSTRLHQPYETMKSNPCKYELWNSEEVLNIATVYIQWSENNHPQLVRNVILCLLNQQVKLLNQSMEWKKSACQAPRGY